MARVAFLGAFLAGSLGLGLSPAWVAIGDPCTDGVCPPGETCIPEADSPGYCTTRCNAGVDCGPDLECRQADSLPFPLCLRPDTRVRAAMGEACQAQGDCEDGLLCFAENDARYCTRYCTLPGTCPEGFRCAGNERPACSLLRGLPGNQEPCAPDRGCADGFACVSHPSRGVPFCALPCAEGQCAEGYACTEDHCVSNPVFMKPGFGEACVGEGADPLLVGCVDGATCLVGESESYCTRACGFSSPCPAGYGCVEIAPDQPECRRGAVTDDRFGPQAGTDGGPLAPPPPVGPTVAPTAAPSAGGGGGGRDSGGCSMTPPQGRHATLGLVALALGGATWRRRRATRRP